jgi:carbamoyl-phosphate synthase small subunit
MVKVVESLNSSEEETRPVSYLLLEDGTLFQGYSFGANRDGEGEIGKYMIASYIYTHIKIYILVFSTGMTGYIESLTDPSYKNQLLVLTYPLIGNYGVPKLTRDELDLPNNFESEKIHASALIVGEYCENYSHWNAAKSLSQWLVESDIPAIDGIDTRKLTKILREKGSMLAKVNVHIFCT